MKKLLMVFVALLLLIVGVLALLIFTTPTGFKVEREIEIAKPKAEVFAYLKELKNQNDWGPWVKKDPNIEQEYVGTDGTVGFISKWESENEEVGAGEQEIKKITDGERIDTEIRFKKPFESNADAYITTEDAGAGKTKVRWGFTSEMPRPMNLLLLVMDMDAEVGKDFDAGLGNLKEIVEKQESPKEEETKEDNEPAQE